MTKTKLIAAIGASTLLMTGAVATTATAQSWRNYQPRYESSNQNLTTSYVDSLEWRINEAARARAISWGEARELLGDLRQVQPLAWRVQNSQASQWEYRRLANTVSRIERATASYASNGRYPRYGWNDDRRDDRRWDDRRW